MIFKIIYSLGGILLAGLGMMVFMAVVMATPGNTPKKPAAKTLQRILATIILATPIWELFCFAGYLRGWIFGTGYTQLLWIPMTLVPIGFVLIYFAAAKRLL